MVEAIIQAGAILIAAFIALLPKVRTGIKSKVPWILVVVLLLALAISNIGVFIPSVEIIYPKPGIEVKPDDNGYFPVVGTAKNISDKRDLWLVTQYPSHPDKYYPAIRKITDDDWYNLICLGKGPKRSVNAIVISVLNSTHFEDYAKQAHQNGFPGIKKSIVESISGFKIEYRVASFSVLKTTGCQ